MNRWQRPPKIILFSDLPTISVLLINLPTIPNQFINKSIFSWNNLCFTDKGSESRGRRPTPTTPPPHSTRQLIVNFLL